MMNKLKLFLGTIIIIILSSCSPNSQHEGDNKLIFKDNKGNQIFLSDLEGVTGMVNWQIVEDKYIPIEAKELHQEAREHGGKGEYDLGIEKLKKAYQLAPNWAYPVYDLAYTYLLQKDFSNALKYYEMTDQMEPKGFFTAKTAYWALKKEKEGKFPEGLYLGFMQIEWANSDKEKIQIAEAIVDKYPEYAPAWKVIADNLLDTEEKLNAIEKGLSSEPDAGTKGGLLINKALAKDLQGKSEEAKKILGELIFNEESTLANIEMAKFVLSTIAKTN